MKLDKSRSGRLRPVRRQEDFSPMEGVGNMADAMLVFACGLLLALIMSWNVDVSETGIIGDNPQTKYEVEGIGEQAETVVEDQSDLEEMGKVYKDPKTGKYYVIEEE